MTRYTVLLHPTSLQRVATYQQALATKTDQPGHYLRNLLADTDPSTLTTAEFIERLVQTKQPQIFAESAIAGDGIDWSLTELSLLGDIAIAVPVTVYDDGRHSAPHVYETPFPATLLYVPGALLRNDGGHTPADWEEVTQNGQLDADGYYRLYERRLLPALLHADQLAGAAGRRALITIPGLGCGQFAGRFEGELGAALERVITRLLASHVDQLPNVRAVYYDPYQECENKRLEIGHISLLVRPLIKGNQTKTQLCPPPTYAEAGDNFSDCQLSSFVAWDHVSWPGNDFYAGSRATDDGVKAAATDSMAVITGVEGSYNPHRNTYDPPAAYRNWAELVLTNQIQLQVKENLVILPA